MTKEEYLSIAGQKYDALRELHKHDNFYDYEKEFEKILKDLGRQVLEANLSELSNDRRKKKTLTKFGFVEISKKHEFCNGLNGFQISPLLQELMVYFGQSECYDKCPEILKKTLDIDIGHSQINRVTDTYGAELGKTISNTRTLSPVNSEEILYAQVDGSMILTRDSDWKEVKVGRIFKSSDCLDPNGKNSWIRHSQYIAHLGHCKEFTAQMDDILDDYGHLKKRLVFISDGAAWIKNWIEDTFSDAISILDYYHAVEHLSQFSNSYFKNKEQELVWLEDQKKLLLESQVNQVIENVKQLDSKEEIATKLVTYFETNKNRMDYKSYKQIGSGIIGSGAIESAHRTVIQKRMKLSGQRWSIEGAKNMLNIRVTDMNKKWENVISLVKKDFRKPSLKKTG